MPFVLILALAASLGIHLLVLFGPQFDLSTEADPSPLMIELKPMPRPPVVAAVKPVPAQSARQSKPRASRRKVERVASASPVLSVPQPSALTVPQNAALPGAIEPLTEPSPEPVQEAAVEPEFAPALTPVKARLPAHGRIRYRVDRGDSNFEIGVAQHEWFIVDGRYRLTSVVETTGLVWLFKSIRIAMESRGLMTAEGLQPETFEIRRNSQQVSESAAFDWERMTVHIAERSEQSLDHGAQDLLSFNYQLGYLPLSADGASLPIATGKNYAIYRLEVLGDEELELPAGTLHTLHLRAPGANSTELWLAYDYLLLPVKIRYVDARGDSYVQVATRIQVGEEPEDRYSR